MDKELRDLRQRYHDRTLVARSIEATINSIKFERLWKDSTDELRKAVKKAIEDNDKKAIALWIKRHPSLELGERSMNYLRFMGKEMRIKGWSRMSKPELISAIESEEG